jgi:hypothetical protein
MALLHAPVPEEVPQVPEDGEDPIAHVCENRHKQRSLLKLLHKRFVVQAGLTNNMVVLEKKKIQTKQKMVVLLTGRELVSIFYMQFWSCKRGSIGNTIY